MRAVGTGYPADVLGIEGLLESLSLPELGRHVGWGDELVPCRALAAGALVLCCCPPPTVCHSGSSGAVPVAIPQCPLRSTPIPSECNGLPSLVIRAPRESEISSLSVGAYSYAPSGIQYDSDIRVVTY